ncbi:lactosylceramide 4-alpha-galactosyltransferase-like [Cloeon dipterum]|uniref:lactosylceramide 4-alpha-galactosyltransferase-like n=1 Tax=Cloeon dipterum TaxID=197152 RepID=UPI0032209C4B
MIRHKCSVYQLSVCCVAREVRCLENTTFYFAFCLVSLYFLQEMLSNKEFFFLYTSVFLCLLIISNHLLYIIWTSDLNIDSSFDLETFSLNQSTTPAKNKISRMFNLTPMLNNSERFHEELGEYVIFLIITKPPFRLQHRFVCCLESLVALNPETSIVILTVGPYEKFGLKGNEAFDELMQNSTNLYLSSVDVSEVIRDTVLEKFVGSNIQNGVLRKPAHLSDFLRMCLLWKLGGAYIDLDLLIIKNLSPILKLKNFLTCDDDAHLNNAFFGFEKHSPFLMKFMETARRKFDKNDYPSVVKSFNIAFEEAFDMTIEEAVKRRHINGLIHVLDHFVVSPARHWEYKLLFQKNNTGFYEHVINVTYGYHTWNSNSGRDIQDVNSTAPFFVAARKFCPRSIELSGGRI